MQLYRSEETVHKIMIVVSIILTIVLFSSMMDAINIPNWLRYCIYIYIIIIVVYGLIRYMIIKKLRLMKYLESTFVELKGMSKEEKMIFVSSGGAEIYFEKVEMVKHKLLQEELLKYKTVLFGTEDPYIVTAEGKIIVKACPGDLDEETKSE